MVQGISLSSSTLIVQTFVRSVYMVKVRPEPQTLRAALEIRKIHYVVIIDFYASNRTMIECKYE